ncbi:hypothetical protein KC363_g2087 [Hortaea werneckii]|nr:hypothetical protein KC361_g874 [Hortaea werneckii]KAI7194441.1 hypothetical protein KC363_g2087 [Hortaea werneckii]KAI7513400.1 hypothetical protein KC347_g1564 [Hortaea werneckii]
MSRTATTGPMAMPAKAPTVRLVVDAEFARVCEEVAAEEGEADGADIETGEALDRRLDVRSLVRLDAADDVDVELLVCREDVFDELDVEASTACEADVVCVFAPDKVAAEAAS